MRVPTAVACAVAVAAPASAAGTLDQQWVDRDGIYSLGEINSGEDRAQTFTAGLTGLLDRVEVQVARGTGTANTTPTAPLRVELRRTIAGVPDTDDASVLASVTVPPSAVPQWVFEGPLLGVDFGDQAVPVAAGDVLAITLRSSTPDGRGYLWAADNDSPNDPYPGGEMYVRASFTNGVFSGRWTRTPPIRRTSTAASAPSSPSRSRARRLGWWARGFCC